MTEHDVDEDREWSLEDYLAECDRVRDNPPPAPLGIALVECDATPRCWPTYEATTDDTLGYPAACPGCCVTRLSREINELRCARDHRRWKAWRIWGWLGSKGYALGVIGSTGCSYGRCQFCEVGRQYHAPRWRGSRSYVLGVRTETWGCLLLRRHRRRESVDCGLCTVCMPCPTCGSTDPGHRVC